MSYDEMIGQSVFEIRREAMRSLLEKLVTDVQKSVLPFDKQLIYEAAVAELSEEGMELVGIDADTIYLMVADRLAVPSWAWTV